MRGPPESVRVKHDRLARSRRAPGTEGRPLRGQSGQDADRRAVLVEGKRHSEPPAQNDCERFRERQRRHDHLAIERHHAGAEQRHRRAEDHCPAEHLIVAVDGEGEEKTEQQPRLQHRRHQQDRSHCERPVVQALRHGDEDAE